MTILKLWLYAQFLVLQQAWVLKVYPLPVVVLPRKIMKKKRGFCMPFAFIAIRKDESFSGLQEVIRHEMRHHWQTIYVGSLCSWWRKHMDIYRRYAKKSPVNWPERDAYQYGKGLDTTLYRRQSVQKLERWYQRGLI